MVAPGVTKQRPGPGNLPVRVVPTAPDGITRVRVLEHTGDHARAAALRLEYAHTLCGTAQRIALLREGCARHSGATEEGRSLHQALAEALLRHAEFMEDGAPRRAILTEAARALEEADQGALAGEIYERLHMLRRAASAYERAGAVTQLEYVLGLIEQIERLESDLERVASEVDSAMRAGRRQLARDLLLEHSPEPPPLARAALRQGSAAVLRAALTQKLGALDARIPRGEHLDLRHGSGQVTRVFLRRELRIGRSPDVELSLTGASLSREHVALRLHAQEGPDPELAVCLVDLGARAGTFWRDEPLLPGEPLAVEGPGELGLGAAAGRVELHPLPRERGELGALLRPFGAAAWTLYLPGGGPLWLAPDLPIPAVLTPRPPFLVLQIAAGVRAALGGEPLGPGADIELLRGDRVHLDLPEGRLTLEIVQ